MTNRKDTKSPPGPSSNVWTDENIVKLKEWVADGFSYAQIAQKLGAGVSRNTVCGKVHRMGLAGFDRPSHPSRPRALAGKPKWRPVSQAGIDRGRSKSGKPFKSVLEPKPPREIKAPVVKRAIPEAQRITAKLHMAGANNGPKAPYTPKTLNVESPNPVTILNLGRFHCRSVDEDTGLYCGNKTDGETSWCAGHRAIFCHPIVTNPQKRADWQTVRLANHF